MQTDAGLAVESQGHAIDPAFLQVLAGRRTQILSTSHLRAGIVNYGVPKRGRLRLDPESYEQLRRQVLRRDGWRCQACGTMSNLEVHHKEFRSHCGDDLEPNLVTLCHGCHAAEHLS